ncbi:TonB-dependent siderophore receptor, partial [Aquabacterium sp.]|uniref:TonB-dependent siderophore receptor n=1 Tax=Aquabacterium sp. TaxID=1872578 RepID=UPI00378434AE
MASHRSSIPFALSALALATLPALAQETTQTVTVTGRGTGNPAVDVAGFGDTPLGKLPLSATSVSAAQLQDAAIASLADITRLDASISDAYNSAGYWSMLTVRGFVLDNRFNFRRDGLPINAETAILLANKSGIEVLKGTSGLQAGTSAPGGLVNFVVKRPPAQANTPVRSASIGWAEDNSYGAAIDLADRVGADGAIGWRLNASANHLDPALRNSQGRNHLLALAGDARVGSGGLLEAEIEISHQRQPSQPGFSLLGSRVPDAHAIDPNLSLNNQPWSLPVVLDGRTTSLRYTQQMTGELSVTAHAMAQRLRSDDRVAFPYGCSAENVYDRYCSDGSFDLYDFRSDGERRNTDALDLSLAWHGALAGLQHQLGAGVLISRYRASFNRQAYNWVGVGSIDGSNVTPPDPTLTDENTNRSERSTEWRLQDAIDLGAGNRLWAGLRSTHLQRDSVRTNGTRPTQYGQTVTTPWLAFSRELSAGDTVYLSWGQGVESEVTPNRSFYSNAGQALPALKSRQWEAGFKHREANLDAGLALFDITRPLARDIGACDDNDESCTHVIDGEQRHRGLEAELDWRAGAWNLRASAMLLRARVQNTSDPSLNGLKPTNVPA